MTSFVINLGRFSFLTLIAVVLFLGCTPETIVEFYNNTDEILTVEGCTDAVTVNPKKFATISRYGCAEKIIVKSTNRSSLYNLSKLKHYKDEEGNTYYHNHRWNYFNVGIYLRLQINPDQKIFILPTGLDFPANAEIHQPNSFPLQPESFEAKQK